MIRVGEEGSIHRHGGKGRVDVHRRGLLEMVVVTMGLGEGRNRFRGRNGSHGLSQRKEQFVDVVHFGSAVVGFAIRRLRRVSIGGARSKKGRLKGSVVGVEERRKRVKLARDTLTILEPLILQVTQKLPSGFFKASLGTSDRIVPRQSSEHRRLDFRRRRVIIPRGGQRGYLWRVPVRRVGRGAGPFSRSATGGKRVVAFEFDGRGVILIKDDRGGELGVKGLSRRRRRRGRRVRKGRVPCGEVVRWRWGVGVHRRMPWKAGESNHSGWRVSINVGIVLRLAVRRYRVAWVALRREGTVIPNRGGRLGVEKLLLSDELSELERLLSSHPSAWMLLLLLLMVVLMLMLRGWGEAVGEGIVVVVRWRKVRVSAGVGRLSVRMREGKSGTSIGPQRLFGGRVARNRGLGSRSDDPILGNGERLRLFVVLMMFFRVDFLVLLEILRSFERLGADGTSVGLKIDVNSSMTRQMISLGRLGLAFSPMAF